MDGDIARGLFSVVLIKRLKRRSPGAILRSKRLWQLPTKPSTNKSKLDVVVGEEEGGREPVPFGTEAETGRAGGREGRSGGGLPLEEVGGALEAGEVAE